MRENSKKSHQPTCSVCHNPFDSYYHTPRIIPKCGHTLCEKCLTSKTQGKANRKVFFCVECGSQTIVRKTVADQFPRNIMIIDVLKDMKKRTLSGNGVSQQQSPKHVSGKCCLEHFKPFQLKCQTCQDQLICSHCAIFGKHKNHACVDISKNTQRISPHDFAQLQKSFNLLQQRVEDVIFPNSPNNVLVKSKQMTQDGLQKVIKVHFRQYYQPIQRRQQQMLKECEDIKIQGGIESKLDKILNEYELVRLRFQSCDREDRNKALDEIIRSAVNLQQQIELVTTYMEDQVSTYVHHIAQKIHNMMAFRQQEISFTLKSLFAGATKNSNNLQLENTFSEGGYALSKSPRVHTSSREDLHKQKKPNIPINKATKSRQSLNINTHQQKQPKQNIIPLSNQNQKDFLRQFRSQSGIPAQSRLTTDSKYQSDYKVIHSDNDFQIIGFPTSNTENRNKHIQKSSTDRYSSHKLTNQASKTPVKSRVTENAQSGSRTKVHAKTHAYQQGLPKTPRNAKKQLPPTPNSNNDKFDLKYVRPVKQINYQVRPKFQQLCAEIDRQHQEGSGTSLELIGRQINDALLVYLVEYLRSKKLKFSMVKLVKNGITDEGFRILVSYLVKDNYTKVLNMTSNHITAKGLTMIMQLAEENKILKTIYLANNKVSSFHLKSKKAQIDKLQLEILL